jgi:HrpA-like RNA helicase
MRLSAASRVLIQLNLHTFLYPSHVHDMELQDYQLPEMLRVGVEELALQILILDLGEPVEFLSKAISPPSAQAMRNSLKLLEKLGAIECQWKDYAPKIPQLGDDAGLGSCAEVNATAELTALGFHLATLPVEPRVGKLIIYGALFGCVDPTLTIAALMSSKSPFISSFDNRESADEARKHFATEGSDHLTALSAFSQWKEMRASKGDRAASNFLKQNYLSRMTLWQIDSLRKQYAGLLKDIGFLPNGFQIDGSNIRPSVGCGANGNAENKALLKAILCAGLYPNVLIAPRSLVDGTSKKQVGEHAFQSLKGDVHLHPSTVSFAEKQMTGRYCVFHNIVKTSKMYVRDCTTVSPFALLLFGGALHVHHQQGVISVDDWLMFRFQGRKPPSLIKYLRSLTESMLLRKIISPEDDVTGSPEGKALIQSISELLQREEPITPRNDGAEIVRPYHGPSEGSSSGMRNGQRGGHGGGRQHRGGGGRGRGGRGRGRNQQQT